jgi:serine/threonine protein kinase
MHPKTPYFKPDLWSTLETPSRYATGGYHPIEIGDTLHHERYRIIHRLGHGGFSTVWLAEDLQFGKLLKHIDPCLTQPPSAHYVAIKVFTAELPQEEYNTAAGQDRWGQAAMKGRISDLLGPKLGKEEDRCESGREFLVEELDEFEIQGPNGVHKAMVMAFLGPSVRALKYCQQEPPYCFYPFPLAVSRRAVAQCAKALAFLHSKGVVHGGEDSSFINNDAR